MLLDSHRLQRRYDPSRSAAPDPLHQKLRRSAIRFKEFVPAVGDTTGRFCDEQARCWIRGCNSPAVVLMHDRSIITIWIASKERQRKISAAHCRAMARARIAPMLGEQWNDVRIESRFARSLCPGIQYLTLWVICESIRVPVEHRDGDGEGNDTGYDTAGPR